MVRISGISKVDTANLTNLPTPFSVMVINYTKGEIMTDHLLKIEFLDDKAHVIGTKYELYSPSNFIILPLGTAQMIIKIYDLVTP